MTIYILQGLALGFAAAVQPGPFMAYLISQTLTHGFRRTWASAFAPLISDGPIITLALLVLSQMPGWLQRGLNFISGAFILYLAWGAFGQWRHFVAPDQTPPPGGSRNVFKAAMMNALSPMPYIYWSLVTGPILIAGWHESPSFGLAFLGSFYVVMIASLLVLLFLFSAARNLGGKISRVLLGVSVLALTVFGVLQVWRGLKG